MATRELDLMIVEQGVLLPEGLESVEPQGTLLLQQRGGESARAFSHRVGHALYRLSERGYSVDRCTLWVSRARGMAALKRRLSLARTLLASSHGRPLSLRLGGPLMDTQRGRLDLAAMAETLNALLDGTGTQIDMVSAPGPAKSSPTAAPVPADDLVAA